MQTLLSFGRRFFQRHQMINKIALKKAQGIKVGNVPADFLLI
jgi:hypothetical protein